MSEWQPIETAPRDGSPVLIIDATAKTPQAYFGHWHGEWRLGSVENWYDEDAGYCLGFLPGATHWMPLPEPPK